MNEKALKILLQEYDKERSIHQTVFNLGVLHANNGIVTPLLPSYVMLLEKSIKDMEYGTFLKTLYWKSISKQVKDSSGRKCRLCSSKENLVVHHNTYKNHGKEHFNHVQNHDLVCLCSRCHNLYHENVDGRKEKVIEGVFDLYYSTDEVDFKEFWETYDKKKGKKLAENRFYKLEASDRVGFLAMISFLEFYREVETVYKMEPAHFINCFVMGRDIKMNGNIYRYKDGVMYVK